MLIDYGYFGDMVSFNTTYYTNYTNKPFAIFFGFNHYRITMIFGVALLYDEYAKSFKWLFEIFLEAYQRKYPK